LDATLGGLMFLNTNKTKRYRCFGGAITGLCNIKSIELTKSDIEELVNEIQNNPKRITHYLGNLILKMEPELCGKKAETIIIDDPIKEV
jgi:hypothetical protein